MLAGLFQTIRHLQQMIKKNSKFPLLLCALRLYLYCDFWCSVTLRARLCVMEMFFSVVFLVTFSPFYFFSYMARCVDVLVLFVNTPHQRSKIAANDVCCVRNLFELYVKSVGKINIAYFSPHFFLLFSTLQTIISL